MINRKQLFCILIAMVIVIIPASGKDWKWTDQSEQGSIALGKKMLNDSIEQANKMWTEGGWIVYRAACAIGLFVYADYLETKRHNAIEEEYFATDEKLQRQIWEKVSITASRGY